MRNIDIDTNADTHKREERKRKEKYFIIAAVALRHIVLLCSAPNGIDLWCRKMIYFSLLNITASIDDSWFLFVQDTFESTNVTLFDILTNEEVRAC